MRITVHLDAFECVDSAAYAILWLDRESRKWSREGHAVIDLPEWGNLVYADASTRVCGAAEGPVACEINGLDLASAEGPFEGESGRVLWYRHAHRTPIAGQWHVQCIDTTESEAENSVFANGDV